MNRESVSAASSHLGELVERARRTRQPTILTADQDNDATLAVVVPAAQYEEYLRLRDAEDQRRVREAVADDRPGRTFTSVAELRAAAGLSPSTGAA
jgi:PHD/YefM family antitoxin component YafN of YafNO toxin-antitoxin module